MPGPALLRRPKRWYHPGSHDAPTIRPAMPGPLEEDPNTPWILRSPPTRAP